MVSKSSIQIVMFAMPVSPQVVLQMFWSMRMRVEQQGPETQTSPPPPVLQLVPPAPPALLPLPVLCWSRQIHEDSLD